jgi:glycosyltransferase involved in cell wall biosynthesis
MISQYDAVIPITKNVLNKWNARLSIKIDTTEVLHQGIDIGHPIKNLEYFDPGNFNIVFAGRIIERKGLMTLLESIKMLQPTINNIKLYIFGEGPFSNEVSKYISGNNLTDKVVLGGYKSDIFSYLHDANLCVFPSYEGEGLMTVVLESMFYNGLVITTHGNGNEEAITDNVNGFLIDPKNPSKLADKIIHIYKNYSKLSDIKANAKSTIKKKFTWNNHAKKFYRLSTELIKS